MYQLKVWLHRGIVKDWPVAYQTKDSAMRAACLIATRWQVYKAYVHENGKQIAVFNGVISNG